MPKYTVPDLPEPVPPGLYEGELKTITEKTAFFKNDDSGEEERRRYFQWGFQIRNDDDFGGQWLNANVSDAFGPKSKQRQWVESMLGRTLEVGEDFTTDDLIGGIYHLTVHHKKKGDRTFAEISSVNKIRSRSNNKSGSTKKAKKAAPTDEEVDATSPDFSDLNMGNEKKSA